MVCQDFLSKADLCFVKSTEVIGQDVYDKIELGAHLYISPMQQATQARNMTPRTVAAVPAGLPPEAARKAQASSERALTRPGLPNSNSQWGQNVKLGQNLQSNLPKSSSRE